ncbi:MAG TPA: hypothetical protein VFC37_05740 [Terracidiphilus sp.]|jgi:hypothetical protein|nr:hypothetical protein [Terracidiphilus sp.]
MRPPARVLGFAVPIALVLPVCGSSPRCAGNPDIPIAVTAAPACKSLATLRGGEHFRTDVDHILTLEEPR